MLRLRVLSGPRAGRQIQVSDTEPVTIGRKTGRVRLHDSRVSKQHAEITFANGSWVLRDLGSSNGSIVNKNVVRGLAELEEGDLLQFGRVLVKVQEADALGMDEDTSPPVVSLAVEDEPAAAKKTPPKPDAFDDDEDDLDLDAIFASENDEDKDEDLAPPAEPSSVSLADEPEGDAEQAQTPSAEPKESTPPAPKPATESKADDEEQYDLVLDLDDEDNKTSAWDELNSADDSSVFDVPSPAAETPEASSESGPTTDAAEQKPTQKPQDASAETGLDDGDLIKIEDDTPDSDRPAGSTIVLPDTGMQPAVDAGDSGLAATPEEVTHTRSADETTESVWDQAQQVQEAEAAPEPSDAQGEELAESALADDSSHDESLADEQSPPAADPELVGANEPGVVASQENQAAPTADTDTEQQQPAAKSDIEVDLAAEDDSEEQPQSEELTEPVDTVEQNAESASQVAEEAAAQPRDLATDHDEPALSKEDPQLLATDSESDDIAADEVEETSEQPEMADSVDASDHAQHDDTTEPTQPAATTVNESDDVETFAEPAFDQDDEDAPAAAEAPSEPAVDDPPMDFDLDDTPAPVSSPDLSAVGEDAPEQEPAQPSAEASEDEPADLAASVNADSDESDDADDFDIDAAFAKLAQGLDDDDEESDSEPTATAPDFDPDDEDKASSGKSGLAGSQLDVDYIQKALAELPQVDDSRHPLGLRSPKKNPPRDFDTQDISAQDDAGSDPDSTEEPAPFKEFNLDEPDETEDDSEQTQSPQESSNPLQTPPGVNPISLHDSVEPRSSKRSRGPRRDDSFKRFLPAAIILLLVGGLVGYIAANPQTITGKQRNVNTPSSYDEADSNGEDQPINDGRAIRDEDQGQVEDDPQPVDAPTRPNPNTGSAFQLVPDQPGQTIKPPTRDDEPDSQSDASGPQLPGTANQPNPFSEGPRIIGPAAVNDPNTTPTRPTVPAQRDEPEQTTSPLIDPGLPSTSRPSPGELPPDDGPDPDLVPDPKPADTADSTTQNTDPPAVPADGDRLVFLVDASGSMVDSFPQMLAWLQEALANLEPQEQFTIIFFQQGKAIEAGDAGLQSMTRNRRQELNQEWLSPTNVPILPAGRSSPEPALKLAVSYEPSDIYLLSDASFARSTGETTRDQAVAAITDILGDAEVRLHGVQFFYQDEQEAGTLQTLAEKTKGTYEFVGEARRPNQDPIDLLQELENRNE